MKFPALLYQSKVTFIVDDALVEYRGNRIRSRFVVCPTLTAERSISALVHEKE